MNTIAVILVGGIKHLLEVRRKLMRLCLLAASDMDIAAQMAARFSSEGKRWLKTSPFNLEVSLTEDASVLSLAFSAGSAVPLGSVVQQYPLGRVSAAPIADLLQLLQTPTKDEFLHVLQLKNNELALATMEAKKASSVKSEFLANMSHEIRTPMNAIIGMTHLALSTGLDNKQRRYLERIKYSSSHLLQIINDILDLSKIEAGRLELENADFDLWQVIEGVISLLSEKCENKQLEFVINFPDSDFRYLKGDPLRLAQILLNFGSNAVKFTETGEVSITVEKLFTSDDEIGLKFVITDTGIGIPLEAQGKLFESFQQADNSTTRRFGGTGLGLVISRQLAKLMDGIVGFDSIPGEGSSFWFTGKFSAGSPAETIQSTIEPLAMRALVIDDYENARIAAVGMLKLIGVPADSAGSGAEGLDMLNIAELEGAPYSLVLLDMRMPDMDGIQTATLMRSLPLLKQPFITLVTGFSKDMVEHNQGVKIFDDFLLKPLHPLGLQQLMARFVPAGSRQTGMVNTVNIDSSKVADFSYLKVLVAEDNLINQEVITALLAEIGISPLIVENGKLALQKLDDESFDLVLMDMQMPVMGGLDATRELRTRPKLSQMPVIALTANAMQKDVADCLAAGMNDHIAKPVDPDILRKVIGKWAPAIDLTPDPAGIAEPGGVLVPDLKRELGLQNCGGRLTLYNSILKKFTEQALVFTLEFEPLYVLGDLQSVIRMAHSLKSSAATIGAESVAATAATLEASLKESLAGDIIMCLFRDLSLVLAALSVAIQREQDGRC